MNRQVLKTAPLQRSLPGSQPDNFADRLVKMIPGEVVAAYLACNTAIAKSHSGYTLFWIVFGIIIALLPLYLRRIMNITDAVQIIIMVIAFVLWCATIEKPFDQLFATKDQQQLYSTIALTLFTFAVPIFYKGK